MKKTILLLLTIVPFVSYAQEHFSAISTSNRGGLLSATNNPAELVNMTTKFEANAFNISVAVANNKLTFSDIIDAKDIENKIFVGNENVNFRFDSQVFGPSFAYKKGKWGFGLHSSATIKANLMNVNTKLGEAITNGEFSNLFTSTSLLSNENQRLNAIIWGELSFNVARNIINSTKHALNVGANIRLLFPGAYANFSVSNLSATLENNFGDLSLLNASASIDLTYAGILATDYSDQNSFNDFFAQGINGFATDFGVNYRLNDENDSKSYKLNTGLSVKNIGSMTFKSENNLNKTYSLNVDGIENLDLNQFEDLESMEEIEAVLSNVVNAIYFENQSKDDDVKIKLPTVINAYADVRLHKKWFITGIINQKILDDSKNEFTTTQNFYSVIPRFTLGWFETYTPISINEISGFTSGIGFRMHGFFVGSNSAISALANNGKQADLHLGVRFGF